MSPLGRGSTRIGIPAIEKAKPKGLPRFRVTLTVTERGSFWGFFDSLADSVAQNDRFLASPVIP
jgi:hypothetical protein